MSQSERRKSSDPARKLTYPPTAQSSFLFVLFVTMFLLRPIETLLIEPPHKHLFSSACRLPGHSR